MSRSARRPFDCRSVSRRAKRGAAVRAPGIFEIAERVIIDVAKNVRGFPFFARRRFWAAALSGGRDGRFDGGARSGERGVSQSGDSFDGGRARRRDDVSTFDLRDSFFPEDSRLRRSARLVAFSFVRFARLI